MKMQSKGSIHQCKVWRRGTPEPGSWKLTGKDSQSSSGYANITDFGASIDVDNVIIRPLKSNTANHAPVWRTLFNPTLQTGSKGTLTFSASDADNDSLFLRAYAIDENDFHQYLPAGISFVDNGDGTGSLSYDNVAAGTYSITLEAKDQNAGAGQSIIVTVEPAGNQPVIRPIPSMTITAGKTVAFDVVATDPQGKAVTLTTSNPPAGATVTEIGTNAWHFVWAVPTDWRILGYPVVFDATSTGGATKQFVTFTLAR